MATSISTRWDTLDLTVADHIPDDVVGARVGRIRVDRHGKLRARLVEKPFWLSPWRHALAQVSGSHHRRLWIRLEILTRSRGTAASATV
jgi:hypothetical protein